MTYLLAGSGQAEEAITLGRQVKAAIFLVVAGDLHCCIMHGQKTQE